MPLPQPKPPIQAAPKVWTEPLTFREAAGPGFKSDEVTSAPSACLLRLRKAAALSVLPRLIGPGACGGSDLVTLEAVLIAGGKRVELKPAPIIRCEMAEALVTWVRDDAVPRVAKMGTALQTVDTYDNFNCRGRNRVRGAKLSEHGKANAVDLRSLTLTDKRVLMLTGKTVDKDLRTDLKVAACARFTTVLGPGSDGYHEEHIHIDLSERRGGYRLCQWNVLEPPPPPPPPKPKDEAEVAKAEPDDDADKINTPAEAAKVTDPAKAATAIAAVRPGSLPDLKPSPKQVPVPMLNPAPMPPLQLTQVAVPLPKARPKPRPVRRKSRDTFHFPFNFLR